MPLGRRGSYGPQRRRGNFSVLVSNKNMPNSFTAAATGANTVVVIAQSVDSAVNTGATEVERGCKIFRIWVELWVYSSAATTVGVTTGIDMYIIKNPGDNLTVPNPGSVGTSNEKKFVFKTFKGLIGARTEGTPPYTFRGWVKIPKIYQRMGADDKLQLVIRPTGLAALVCNNFIYKWFK